MTGRTAVIKDVPDSDLMGVLGEKIEVGWQVRQLVPTSHQFVRSAGSPHSFHVTHWTVVLQFL